MTGGGHCGSTAQPCLFLLFDRGTRPTPDDVRLALTNASVGTVSHDPRSNEHDGARGWLELLVDGLTFDLLGLAPGPAVAAPARRHHFGLRSGAADQTEAIGIAPGPHLSGAANSIPVVRSLMRLAATLAGSCDGAHAAVWAPTASAMGRDLFIRFIESWLAGGPFPALGLTAVVERPGGLLGSDGLTFFTGQELVLDQPLSEDRVAGTRLLIRLIDTLVGQPALAREGKIVLAAGESLHLVPDKSLITVTGG